jgi:hypothetical protein
MDPEMDTVTVPWRKRWTVLWHNVVLIECNTSEDHLLVVDSSTLHFSLLPTFRGSKSAMEERRLFTRRKRVMAQRLVDPWTWWFSLCKCAALQPGLRYCLCDCLWGYLCGVDVDAMQRKKCTAAWLIIAMASMAMLGSYQIAVYSGVCHPYLDNT